MLKGGMKLNELVCSDFLRIWPWWLLNTIRDATTFNAALIKTYDSVFAPVSRLVEYFFEPPSGKSLIAIAIKN